MDDNHTLQSAWSRVELARELTRPTASAYLDYMMDDLFELHGDRHFAEDLAIVGGVGRFCGYPVTILGQEKGTTTPDKIARNFGSPHPEGYRKTLRLMKQAEKFHRPVICIVDTQGAFSGIGAEARGQGMAIAENLRDMMLLKVPVLTIFVGEGGSGGALAMAVADRIAMLENAIYSILSPEGFASILWKDSARAREAAEVMKLTAQDAHEMGIIDDILPEPDGGAHIDPDMAMETVKGYTAKALDRLIHQPIETLLEARYNRFRRIGDFR